MYLPTTATHKLLKLNHRLRGIAGGTSAGKTISILQILIDFAQNAEKQTISVVSESFPHLRRGAMRDFLNIMEAQDFYVDEAWSKTDFTYTFPTGSKIEFFSADQPGKVRGPRRDVLFVNEANNIDYEAFDQLRIRTNKVIWLDWNPTSEFWWYTEILPNYDDLDFITLTYKDNEGLDPRIVADIESHRHNKAWWRVYGEGQLGEVEGRVFTGWQVIDDIPHEARLVARGLDFGFSHDPAALMAIYKYNGGFILDEEVYQLNLHNQPLAQLIKNLPHPETTVFADSQEPKSIDELKMNGINIISAQKGPGSIRQGIDYMQDQRISMTKRSVNLIKEYRNYMWETDKDGKILRTPIDINNHAMDATRYALETYSRNAPQGAGIVTSRLTPPNEQSFLVDEEGNIVDYKVDMLAAAKASLEDNNDWRYV